MELSYSLPDLNDPIAFVTGATSGLGLAVATRLATHGYTTIITGRSLERTQAAVDHIAAAAGHHRVDAYLADLAHQTSIRTLTDKIANRYPRLDLFVSAAANVFYERTVTPDGIESQWAINHLAPFLLTHRLLPRLKSSPAPRIVIVASRVNTTINFDDFQYRSRPYDAFVAYRDTKLANILFTFELARRLAAKRHTAATTVTANCVHPGVFRSNLGRRSSTPQPGWLQLAARLGDPLLTPPEKAAQRVLHLATSPDLAHTTGKYFGDKTELKAPPQAYDPVAQQQLWQISAQLTRLDPTAI